MHPSGGLRRHRRLGTSTSIATFLQCPIGNASRRRTTIRRGQQILYYLIGRQTALTAHSSRPLQARPPPRRGAMDYGLGIRGK